MACEQRVAIVTGSAQGIGYAIVKELLETGYKVCMCDINEVKGNSSASELQKQFGESNVLFLACDVSQKSHYTEIFEYVLHNFKRIDLLVNNAGIVNELETQKMIGVNLMGPIYGCESALKYMGKDKGGNGGMVINMSSMAAIRAAEHVPVYSASKYGILGLTRGFGGPFHYERSGIMFCAICPGWVDTNLIRTHITYKPEMDCGQRDDLMDPSYIAKAVTKLLKDKKNGGVLLALEEGFNYVEESLEGVPKELYEFQEK